MLNFYPFKGYRYNEKEIANFSDVISPPYDVINSTMQEDLYEKSPFNFVRIILNKVQGSERYQTSAKLLQEWLKDGIFIQEHTEYYYLIRQSYELDNQLVERIGLIGELELEEFGENIMPHEETIEKHIEDRFKLMEATGMNLGQIFMIYRDYNMTVDNFASEIMNHPALMEFTLPDGVRSQIWRISEGTQINQIQQCMRQSKAIIADGHHRYKTALKYWRANKHNTKAGRVMVTMVNALNPGMQVLPTYRLIKETSLSPGKLKQELKSRFELMEVDNIDKLVDIVTSSKDKPKFTVGIYDRRSDTSMSITSTATLKDDLLDVEFLHKYLLKEILNVDSDNQDDLKNIEYIKGTDKPSKLLENRYDYDLLFLGNPPTLDQIYKTAEAGETMPQKSTFFYPKVNSGAILRSV